MDDILERKRIAHDTLGRLVQILTEIHNDEHPEDAVSNEMATSWVLCVGYENMPEDPKQLGTNGSVIAFPKDDMLPGWKINGILRECLDGHAASGLM
ncbi:hypothetical protein SEA_PHEROBRINE_76 [Gordonia phage Pherobrine]|nr:hypothetical protein SEA_PHEROBRINE_76 [Gordonia phage Pherobrine]